MVAKSRLGWLQADTALSAEANKLKLAKWPVAAQKEFVFA